MCLHSDIWQFVYLELAVIACLIGGGMLAACAYALTLQLIEEPGRSYKRAVKRLETAQARVREYWI